MFSVARGSKPAEASETAQGLRVKQALVLGIGTGGPLLLASILVIGHSLWSSTAALSAVVLCCSEHHPDQAHMCV